MRINIFSYSLLCSFLLAGAFCSNCYSKDTLYNAGAFKGLVRIELSDDEKQKGFELSLKDGSLKPSYEVNSVGKCLDVLKHCFKPSYNPDFQNKYKKYRSVKNEIVPVLEQRLNKDNCTQLQRLADRDFAFFRKYKIQGDFIDIRSKQDGTILKNFNSTLFHPNGQFTYAVYGLEQRVLIDLNKVILYPLPHGLRFLDGEPCRDPVAWSSDGKYYVLQNNENFYTDKSISGQEKISYKSRLSVMNAEKNQAIFETVIDGIVGSVAWSPDLASLAVVSNFYHYHTDMPWQWLPGKLRIAREHYTYNLELFNLSTGEKHKYALSQDSKLWALDDLIWIK